MYESHDNTKARTKPNRGRGRCRLSRREEIRVSRDRDRSRRTDRQVDTTRQQVVSRRNRQTDAWLDRQSTSRLQRSTF